MKYPLIPLISTDTWELNNLELKLSQLKHVDYVKINKVNKSIEFHLKVKSYTEEYRETIEKINSICNDDKLAVVEFIDCEEVDFSGVDLCQYPELVFVNLPGTPNNFEETQNDCYEKVGEGYAFKQN